jgi:hypothetical protein
MLCRFGSPNFGQVINKFYYFSVPPQNRSTSPTQHVAYTISRCSNTFAELSANVPPSWKTPRICSPSSNRSPDPDRRSRTGPTFRHRCRTGPTSRHRSRTGPTPRHRSTTGPTSRQNRFY